MTLLIFICNQPDKLEESKAQKEKTEDELALQSRHLEEIVGQLMGKTVELKK